MYAMVHAPSEIDALVASGEPESTVVAEASKTRVFGVAMSRDIRATSRAA